MRRILLAVGLLAIGACGGSGDGEDVVSDSTAVTTETVSGSGTTDESAADADDEPAPDTTEPATTEAPPAVAEVDGDTGLLPLTLPAITVTEGDPGVEGAGRPTFAWDAVEGAAEYFVVVHLGGQPDWGVTTTDTSATVGGATLHPNATGPRVTNDMVWYVVASDADGTPIAQSASQPVITTID